MSLHAPRIREAGDSALLLEWEEVIDAGVNERAIAMAAAMRSMRLPGTRDVVSTYRSVAIFFDPLITEPRVFCEEVARLGEVPAESARGKAVEVPVAYGGEAGPDLGTVAAWAGLSTDAVVGRHAGTEYRVFMLGFLPGFAYLGSVDPGIAAPRRDAPRVRVPPGSVGIAGKQTGIYPRESPGGWQIIGRSPVRVFDPERVPPALLLPGDTVRFMPVLPSETGMESASPGRIPSTGAIEQAIPSGARTATVVRPGLFTTIQDRGRWGHQASGVPVSGALDLVSHAVANLLVGNDADAATLEATLAGPELRFEQPGRVAVTGADLQASIDGVKLPPGVAVACRAGSVLRFGERLSGARAYVAVDGGIDVRPVLGSRATHVGAGLGGLNGRALMAGDRLALGPPVTAHAVWRLDPPAVAIGGARLRVLPGPQDDFFPESAFALLESARFQVTPQSNRMGYRLSGATVPRIPNREMISDCAFAGGIQVPASGEPILLMSDRQTTGGYPQIATVITADLPLAGQLAPGDWVEFAHCTRSEAIAALREQEERLRVRA